MNYLAFICKTLHANCLLMSCVLVCACGSGGSGVSAPQTELTVAESELNGVVVDGYLVGAKVCLDLNTNWVCDPTEPSAITTAGGKYKLDVTPLKYWETYDKLVIAEVGPDAYDEDVGKTLKEQGIAGYTLGSHGGAKPTISPMNTLGMATYLHHDLMDLFELTALETAASANGLSKTGEDYFDPEAKLSSSDRELAKNTGKILARALATTQAKLIADLPEIYSPASPGLGSRVASVLVQALKDTIPDNEFETPTDKLNRIKKQVSAIPLRADYEKLFHAKTVVLSAKQALDVLDEGLYDSNLLGSLPKSLVQIKSSGDGGSLNVSNFEYRGNYWNKDSTFHAQGSVGNHFLYYTYEQGPVYNKMVEHKVSIPSSILVNVDGVLKEKMSGDPNAPMREIQVIAKQVNGLPFASVPGLSGFQGNFSAGQNIYKVRRKTLQTEYAFDEVATFFKSLSEFIASPRTCYAGVCWSITKNSSGNAPGYEGAIHFTTTSSAGNLDLG